MNIQSKELFMGDYVRWDSSGGQAYGRIIRRVTDGSLQVPQTDFVLEGTEDNPAYLIRLFRRNDDGNYEETSTVVGHRETALTRSPSPENMKEVSIEIEIEEDEEDEDEIEGEEVDETEDDEEDNTYELDKLMQEEMSFAEEMSNCINKGDYVRFEASGGSYRGRVVEVSSDSELMSTAGYKLEGREDDPAVLIRLYNETEDGTLEESDMKVVHRMSSLIKIPSLSYNYFPKPKKNADIGKRETKVFAFNVEETKEIEIDGEKYGIVRGYASTYGNVDRGNDRVMPGAFAKSLDRYMESKRPIKMYFNHNSNEIIGGFPVEKIRDDANGLYVEGQINLGVQKGREAYALAKQGVMQDFSIGYTVDDYDLKGGVRQLKQLELWEISMVGEPMNPEARILTVKNNENNKKTYQYDDVANLKDKRDFERLLRDSGVFSRKAATYLSSLLQVKQSDSVDEIEINEMKNLLNYLKNRG